MEFCSVFTKCSHVSNEVRPNPGGTFNIALYGEEGCRDKVQHCAWRLLGYSMVAASSGDIRRVHQEPTASYRKTEVTCWIMPLLVGR